MSKLLIIVAVIGVFLLGAWGMGRMMMEGKTMPITVDVIVPALSPQATLGALTFNNNCARCHGLNAGGSVMGPPLVHPIYRPSHHADGAVSLAVKNGVRAHHWPFGNMPPQRHISAEQVVTIVAYIRELQRANGITE